MIRKIARKNTLMGKVARHVTSLGPISRKRRGRCRRCGACCRILWKCHFLKMKNGRPHCAIYRMRPPKCSKYPRTPDEFFTQKDCGFWFEK